MTKQETNRVEEKMEKTKNKMADIEIEKVVLSVGAVGEELDKAAKLLEIISGMKAIKTKSRKRIPAFNIRPGLEIGCKVTLRGESSMILLKRLLEAIGNQLKEKQIKTNGFSFGIPEYIEIPDMEYQRDIGMLGLNITVVFTRKGKRIQIKKIKRGQIPKRQQVSKEEIVKFMQLNFKTEIFKKGSKGEEQ